MLFTSSSNHKPFFIKVETHIQYVRIPWWSYMQLFPPNETNLTCIISSYIYNEILDHESHASIFIHQQGKLNSMNKVMTKFCSNQRYSALLSQQKGNSICRKWLNACGLCSACRDHHEVNWTFNVVFLSWLKSWKLYFVQVMIQIRLTGA